MLTEQELQAVMQGDSVLSHDDALVLRGQKHTTGLEQEWWRKMPKTGRVTGWWNTETNEHQPQGWEPGEGDSASWVPCSERALDLSKGVRLVAYGNALELRMRNLWDDLRRRYRIQLEAVVQADAKGILSYRGRHEVGTRERQEAIRNRLRKHWKVAAYEHDLIFTGDIAETLFREVQEHAEREGLVSYEDTVYLKGHDRVSGNKKPLLVKVYRMSKHGLPNAVKVEVTFRSDYLKRHDLRDPAAWETQPDIQQRVQHSLIREWRAIMQHTPATKRKLTRELGTTQRELFDTIAGNRNTLSARVEALERGQVEIRQRLERLERQNMASKPREW